MKIRKDKIEVKVKEEEVQVAEITEDELVELAAQANAKCTGYIVKRFAKKGEVELAKELGNTLTDFAALFTSTLTELIYGHEEDKEEEEE